MLQWIIRPVIEIIGNQRLDCPKQYTVSAVPETQRCSTSDTWTSQLLTHLSLRSTHGRSRKAILATAKETISFSQVLILMLGTVQYQRGRATGHQSRSRVTSKGWLFVKEANTPVQLNSQSCCGTHIRSSEQLNGVVLMKPPSFVYMSKDTLVVHADCANRTL